MKRILILITMFILFAGCEQMTEQVKPLNEAKSSLPRNLQPDTNEESIEKVVDGNTDFAINLYKNLPNQEENIIFSPYSISLAMAMTQAGARVETLQQMNDVLRFASPSAELHPSLNALQLELSARK